MGTAPESWLTAVCVRCERPLRVRKAWIGKEVQCPHCGSPLLIPQPKPGERMVRSRQPRLAPRHQFNFACPRCETLLEAHTGMSGQAARCPSCAANLIVPSVNLLTGRVGRAGLLEDAPEAPTPVHAYAASGEHAPRILRRPDGSQVIVCPQCQAESPIDADACLSCGTPFTMEAAATMTTLRRDRWSRKALVMGIASIPLFFLLLPAAFAVVLGLMGSGLLSGKQPNGYALAGLVLGVLSLAGGLAFWLI